MHFFDPSTAAFQFQSFGLLGIDGISLWLVWLVNMLMPIVILSSWKSVNILIKPFIL
jgi:NADH:ubiquinone oxidoreductase subunit 4 (subunit M)